VLVAVAPDDVDAVTALARTAGVPVVRLGTTGGAALVIEDVGTLPLDELRASWEATLPALFDAPSRVTEATQTLGKTR
jgi:phosphoribosylformylglycinamidine synthase